jgi:hypothetical protein
MLLRGIDTGLPRTCDIYAHELLAVFTLLFSADIVEKNLDKNALPPFHLHVIVNSPTPFLKKKRKIKMQHFRSETSFFPKTKYKFFDALSVVVVANV